MQKWMISANGKIYDHASAFEKWGYIDWRQRAKFNNGDIVYIGADEFEIRAIDNDRAVLVDTSFPLYTSFPSTTSFSCLVAEKLIAALPILLLVISIVSRKLIS